VGLVIALAIICGVAVLARINFVYWSERRAMTPQERAEADAEDRADAQVW
jgi:hypothetical protein